MKIIFIMFPIIDLRKKIFIETDYFSNKLNEPNLLDIDYFDLMKCSDYDSLKEILFFDEYNIHNTHMKNIIIYHLLYISLVEKNEYISTRKYSQLENIELLDEIRIKLRKIFLI
jgi:hypothetical protein